MLRHFYGRIADVNNLLKYFGEKWTCTPDRYPEMNGMNEDETLHFVLRHSALHFSKTAGRIAAASEDSDHGKRLNIEDLKINVAKSLINTLYLAGQLKMTEEELESLVKKIVDSSK